jgi:hypothetical protein
MFAVPYIAAIEIEIKEHIMKKKRLFINRSIWVLAALVSVFILGSCLSAATPIAYEDSTPPEKKCTLLIAGNLTVTGFDSKEVKWLANFGDTWASVQIPEGGHDFILDYHQTVNGGFRGANAVHAGHDFIAGHTYQMLAQDLGTLNIVFRDVTK